jgi:hypothetical protein
MEYDYNDPVFIQLTLPAELESSEEVNFVIGNFKDIPATETQAEKFRNIAYAYSSLDQDKISDIYTIDFEKLTFSKVYLPQFDNSSFKKIVSFKFLSLMAIMDVITTEDTRIRYVWNHILNT